MSIVILMSTYNGNQYLKEQLDSIVNQTVLNDCTLFVRDDGSNDDTVNILDSYKKKINMIIEEGNNFGFCKSFNYLLRHAPNADYYAFCDQDDVWLPNKLEIAIKKIRKYTQKPEMYFCNCELVNEQLESLGKMYLGLQYPNNKFDNLLENKAAGCTIVFNRVAREYYLKTDCDNIVYHDFWMFVLCSYFGSVIYDQEPHILYRIHNNNFIGAKPDFIKTWKYRFFQIKNRTHMRENMATELLTYFSNQLTPKDIQLLQLISNYRKSIGNRISLLFSNTIKLSTIKKTFWFKIHVIIGNV